MRKIGRAAALVAGLCWASGAWAGVIPTRSALDTILGGGGTTEGFEAYPAGNNASNPTNVSHLDSTTIVNGHGPGLIDPGLSFDFGGSHLQWNGPGYFDLPTNIILSFDASSITINFLQPTTAFGVDLYAFVGFPGTATATVFDTLGSIIDTTSGLDLPGAPTSTFFGYQDAGGIGKVEFSDASHSYSPLIDNVTFGNPAAVPEPSSLALACAGGLAVAYARRPRPAA